MKMYHGTTEEAWNEIQKDGMLWGRKNRIWEGHKLSRINWLATKKEYARVFENNKHISPEECVLLEVDMPDVKECDYWEYVTYEPILLSRVKRIK